jgi:hypothetical protein
MSEQRVWSIGHRAKYRKQRAWTIQKKINLHTHYALCTLPSAHTPFIKNVWQLRENMNYLNNSYNSANNNPTHIC